jgi:hypothetical protein
MPFAPAAFGFHPGTPIFQPATIFQHPFLAGHPNGGQSFPQQQFVFATTSSDGQTQQFFHAHPQANYAFPFILSPPIATPQTLTSNNPESPIFTYTTPTSTVTTPDSSTYSA